MVASERAMMLLSSFTASVTLLDISFCSDGEEWCDTHMSWLGFFFFLRIAVETSSS